LAIAADRGDLFVVICRNYAICAQTVGHIQWGLAYCLGLTFDILVLRLELVLPYY